MHQVTRDTTVVQLREALVEFTQRPLEAISIRLDGAALADHVTVEAAALFGLTSQLEVLLRLPRTPGEREHVRAPLAQHVVSTPESQLGGDGMSAGKALELGGIR